MLGTPRQDGPGLLKHKDQGATVLQPAPCGLRPLGLSPGAAAQPGGLASSPGPHVLAGHAPAPVHHPVRAGSVGTESALGPHQLDPLLVLLELLAQLGQIWGTGRRGQGQDQTWLGGTAPHCPSPVVAPPLSPYAALGSSALPPLTSALRSGLDAARSQPGLQAQSEGGG